MKKLMFIDRINFLSFRSNFGLLRFKNLKIVRKIFFFFRVEKFLLVFFIKFFFLKYFIVLSNFDKDFLYFFL